MLVQTGRKILPRKAFIEDLARYIQDLQKSFHEVMLCLDAHESYHRNNAGIRRLATTCGLLDVHSTLFPEEEIPSHKKGTSKIDYCFALPKVLSSVLRAGILPFDTHDTTDHRPMFVDIDITQLFASPTSDPTSQSARKFTTKNKKRTSLFLQDVQKEWTRRKLSSRIQTLAAKSRLPTVTLDTAKLKTTWEKIDQEIGRVIQHAECELHTPRQKHQWSPAIMQANATKQYWKARCVCALNEKPTSTKQFLKSIKDNIKDDGCKDIGVLAERYAIATEQLSIMLKQDVKFRESFFNEKIEALENQSDSQSKKELAALKALRRLETQS